MRVIAYGVAAVLGLALSGPVAAADGPKPKKDKSQQIVCKDIEVVGSHIPDRVCRTRAEWDEAAKQSHDALDKDRTLGVDPSVLCPECKGG